MTKDGTYSSSVPSTWMGASRSRRMASTLTDLLRSLTGWWRRPMITRHGSGASMECSQIGSVVKLFRNPPEHNPKIVFQQSFELYELLHLRQSLLRRGQAEHRETSQEPQRTRSVQRIRGERNLRGAYQRSHEQQGEEGADRVPDRCEGEPDRPYPVQRAFPLRSCHLGSLGDNQVLCGQRHQHPLPEGGPDFVPGWEGG